MTYGQLQALLNKIDKYEKILDEIDKYEKILDEIREYIKNENYKDENICLVDGIEILQILDKVDYL